MMAEDSHFVLSHEEEQVVRALLASLRRIQYGSVQITVQDGHVVQIDTLEKQRLSPSISRARERAPRTA
jgi:hypothetical protein